MQNADFKIIGVFYNFMKFILASASPRRKEILLNAGYKFTVVPSCYNEKICNMEYSEELVENCAFQKALEVKNRLKNGSLIVSADTVVVIENKILGKPSNEAEAFDMLSKLSGATHFVATSICILDNYNIVKGIESTKVIFRDVSSFEIKNYIKKNMPYDKAGSYGIQDKDFDFVKKIEGNIDNVIGFPMTLFKRLSKEIFNNFSV